VKRGPQYSRARVGAIVQRQCKKVSALSDVQGIQQHADQGMLLWQGFV